MKKYKFLSVLLVLFLVASMLSACEFKPVSPDTPLTKAPDQTTVAPATQSPQTQAPGSNSQTTIKPTTTEVEEIEFTLVEDPTGNGYVPSLNKVRMGETLTKVKNLSIADYLKKATDYERVLVEIEGYAVSIDTEKALGIFYLIDTNGDNVYVYGCSKLGTEFAYTSLETGGYNVVLTTPNPTYTNLKQGGKGNFIEDGKALIEEGQYVRLIGIYGVYNGIIELHAELVAYADLNISSLGSIYTPKATGDNVTAAMDHETYNIGDTCTMTLTPDTSYAIKSVQLKRINGTIENLTLTDNKVSFTVGYSDTVLISTEDTALENGTKCATFELGSDVSTNTHKDGSALKEDYTETDGSYTLTITDISKVYSKANDAKNNGCLKLGTGSEAASFTFTVANDVDYVIIYVSGYKTSNGAVKVNGVDYTITAHSDDGEYQAIKIDTRTNKTISFETTSPGRAMINTIEYYKIDK